MSRENVEIVRRVFEAGADGDAATVLSLYGPEVEWDVSSSPFGRLIGRGPYHGHDGLRAWFRERADAFEAAGLNE